MEDSRFTHVASNPKFRPIPKDQRKVKIDKRFQSMFKDKRFQVKYTTDKRGRPVNHSTREDLRRYYELSSEDDSSESDSENENNIEGDELGHEDNSSESESESTENAEVGKCVDLKKVKKNDLKAKNLTDKTLTEKAKKKLRNLKIDYARGEKALFSESSSDDDEESEEELSETEGLDHKWGELDNDADHTEEPTYRLAACNMDWDRIRAIDLMVLFNSFLPSGSVIKSVVIYPSEFGKARMKEEEVKGPTELVENKVEEDEGNEEGSSYHMEKLRQYQLNRLKYYYAVITFDSANTANKIYTECDGMEYESSAVRLDLRFISDDLEFDDEPKEMCDKLPEVNKYQPRFFTTTALQQAKVDLTWDETNPDRLEIAQKFSSGKLDEISEADLHNYLASSSDDEEENKQEKEESDEDSDNDNGKNSIDKYKALLMDIEEKEKVKKDKDVEMEISWGIDLKEKTEELVKKKQNNSEDKTPFEQYLDKRKEKRKEKRNKKKTANQEDSDSDMPSDIDMNDPYFAEEFEKKEFKKPGKKEKQVVEAESGDEKQQAELDLLLMNEAEGKKHFSLKKIQDKESDSKSKKKRKNKNKISSDADKSKPVDDFEVNVEDERFSALFNSHHFNIDPFDPHYKKTKGTEKLVAEKLKRRAEGDEENVAKKPKEDRSSKRNPELSLLVKSIKRKTSEYKKK